MLRAAQQALDEGFARAHPGRPPRGCAGAHRPASICASRIGDTVELVDPTDDPRYERALAPLSRADGAQGRVARRRPRRGADAWHGDRGADGAPRRGGCDAVRRDRSISQPSARCRRHRRAGAEGDRAGGAVGADPAQGHLLPMRHLRRRPAERRPACRNDACARPTRCAMFGVEPKVALLSHSSFGSSDTASAQKMREALSLLREHAPGLEVEGEMHADAAIAEEIRHRDLSPFAAPGRGQSPDHAQPRCRQHRLQHAQGAGRRARGRARFSWV